jgi:hypothetical protein
MPQPITGSVHAQHSCAHDAKANESAARPACQYDGPELDRLAHVLKHSPGYWTDAQLGLLTDINGRRVRGLLSKLRDAYGPRFIEIEDTWPTRRPPYNGRCRVFREIWLPELHEALK